MAGDRQRVRVVLLAEDRLLERLGREALSRMGVNRRAIRVKTAPPGSGSGKAWIDL